MGSPFCKGCTASEIVWKGSILFFLNFYKIIYAVRAKGKMKGIRTPVKPRSEEKGSEGLNDN